LKGVEIDLTDLLSTFSYTDFENAINKELTLFEFRFPDLYDNNNKFDSFRSNLFSYESFNIQNHFPTEYYTIEEFKRDFLKSLLSSLTYGFVHIINEIYSHPPSNISRENCLINKKSAHFLENNNGYKKVFYNKLHEENVPICILIN
jgi:hypothetical protein